MFATAATATSRVHPNCVPFRYWYLLSFLCSLEKTGFVSRQNAFEYPIEGTARRMDAREDALTQKSQDGMEMSSVHDAVRSLYLSHGLANARCSRSLGSALVYPDAGNFETNRKLWELYAAEWHPTQPWVTGKRVSQAGDRSQQNQSKDRRQGEQGEQER
eukprot:scaffold926_cov248-Pinguiococcus_pyrenoidosus.AAC.11